MRVCEVLIRPEIVHEVEILIRPETIHEVEPHTRHQDCYPNDEQPMNKTTHVFTQ